ncbi:MAG TPA: preprotein translocase subunit SecE [bacterium]|jgi:preprotein translocase subunit SecE|nr:preprotein translocase subunit SecE [bacterium]HOG38476.1 preprotein translocase subunit SecE [bacterium]HQI03533.1 preprotein translocase subunit SecE [bacterium]
MFNKLIQYIKDSIKELRKVVWPSKKETTKKTLQVIFVSIVVALFLGLTDFLLSAILTILIK